MILDGLLQLGCSLQSLAGPPPQAGDCHIAVGSRSIVSRTQQGHWLSLSFEWETVSAPTESIGPFCNSKATDSVPPLSGRLSVYLLYPLVHFAAVAVHFAVGTLPLSLLTTGRAGRLRRQLCVCNFRCAFPHTFLTMYLHALLLRMF